MNSSDVVVIALFATIASSIWAVMWFAVRAIQAIYAEGEGK